MHSMRRSLFLLAGEIQLSLIGSKITKKSCRSWGSTLAGDVASHLPPGSVHGAVYVAAHPTLRNMIPLAFTPGLTSLWEWASNDDAQASNYPIVLNRLCFARMPNVSSSFYEETVRLNDEGEDFVPENPAATYGIRLATMGMITTMKPIHRRLTAEHLNDGDILELLANGFPILEVIVTHDTFLKYDMVLESLKSISKNLDVHLIRGASHTPFVHAPDEVMKAGHTKVRGEGPHAVHTVSPVSPTIF